MKEDAFKYSFKKVSFEDIDLLEYNNFPNKSVLTTYNWIKFLVEDSKAEPYILKVLSGSELIGYFTALKVSKFGMRIIASPFPGWSTPYMGFDFYDNSIKIKVFPELVKFIKVNDKCPYFQFVDRDITFEQAKYLKKDYGYILESGDTLELRVNADDKQLYKNMKNDCRNYINQFERRGATIEFAEPNNEFAEDYYNQLLDVFAKQKLVPTYGVDKVKCLLKHLSENDSVLCLRVRDPDGKSIATSIFPGYNKKFFFWGGASLRNYQQYRPNEYMIYTAMKYWRSRGCEMFDMVGIRPYKEKFGSWEVHYPIIIVPKYLILYYLKNIAAWLYYFMGGVKWRYKHLLTKI